MPRPRIPDDQKLVTHTVRLTQQQDVRFAALAAEDGLPVQDHWRRAMDLYLSTLAWTKRSNAPADTPSTPNESTP